jgi:hypothetical protein
MELAANHFGKFEHVHHVLFGVPLDEFLFLSGLGA